MTHTYTLSRIPLDEWSARRNDLYSATHNTHKRQTSKFPAGFEPAIPASQRPPTHVLRCAGHRDRLTFVFLLLLLLFLFVLLSTTAALRPVFCPRPPLVFFLQSHLDPAAERHFLVLTNMAVTSRTSSSHLFLGFPAGPLSPKLRSRICFGFLLSNILTTCSDYFHVLTRINVTMSACSVLHSAVCFRSHSFVLV